MLTMRIELFWNLFVYFCDGWALWETNNLKWNTFVLPGKLKFPQGKSFQEGDFERQPTWETQSYQANKQTNIQMQQRQQLWRTLFVLSANWIFKIDWLIQPWLNASSLKIHSFIRLNRDRLLQKSSTSIFSVFPVKALKSIFILIDLLLCCWVNIWPITITM